MSDVAPEVLLGIAEIAKITDVGRSAVSNWRKRHADFPAPRVQAPSGALFDLDDVERWLIENDKISAPIPRDVVVWQLAEAMRGTWTTHEWGEFLVACLVYLEACERGTQTDAVGLAPVSIDSVDAWQEVRTVADDELVARLLAAATRIEQHNPLVEGLIRPGLDRGTKPNPGQLRQLLDTLEEAATGEFTPRFVLFEELVGRLQSADRFRAEHATPESLTRLLTQLAGPANGTILDLACGEGGLLLMAGLVDAVEQDSYPNLIGYEVVAQVARHARARFFVYGVTADIRNDDVFGVLPENLPKSDAVVLDPPLGVRDWGDADIYLRDTWVYGRPSPKKADLAWPQLALACLNPDGRAIVVMAPGANFRQGRDAAIRKAMLDAGVIEAVIGLPPRLRVDTSIELTIWVLRPPPQVKRGEVLLVDASTMGQPGRSQYTIEDDDIDLIVRTVRSWRGGHLEESEPGFAQAIPIDELEDTNLMPNRYRPVAQPDTHDLLSRATRLRLSLAEHTRRAVQAVADALEPDPATEPRKEGRRVSTRMPSPRSRDKR